MSKRIDLIRLTITILITAILMATTSITIYGSMAKPQFYAHFIELGNKYLQEGKYQEAILEFQKAIKIEAKSTKARIGVAKGSIELDDIDTAVKVLKEAQQIDIENKELLKEIIDILKDVDPEATYEILMNYVNWIGEENIDSDIRELLNSAKEQPKIPEIIPPSGTYIKPFSAKLKSDKVRIGHTFYYTTDGSDPSKKADLFRGSIKVEEATIVKFIGYNPAGDSTDIFEVNYEINTDVADQIDSIISTSKSERDNTEEGTEVGNCIPGAKEELNEVLDKAEKALKKNIISIEEGNAIYEQLNDALYNFRQKIIVPTDKSELKTQIDKAEQLVNSAVEGSEVGQYRSGAKAEMNQAISDAKKIYEDLIARQETIDAAKDKLISAINRFVAKKVTELDKIIANTGAKIGPVTVSLLWNTIDDLDLHVTSPNGDTISFHNKIGSSGGQLDVDRQVSSFVENPVENIYWQTAPHGTYTVRVNLFTKRTDGNIPFQVRTLVDGEAKVYDMSVSSGTINVCTFTY